MQTPSLGLETKGSRQKKPGYFTVRLTVRVDPPPPPLTVSCFVFFSEVYI